MEPMLPDRRDDDEALVEDRRDGAAFFFVDLRGVGVRGFGAGGTMRDDGDGILIFCLITREEPELLRLGDERYALLGYDGAYRL